MSNNTLPRWHEYTDTKNPELLAQILHEEAVFHSPVVHTPQVGKPIVTAYLQAAMAVFAKGSFEYVGEWASGNGAVLEFRSQLDGVVVNGVDIISWDDEGLIVDFKVMVRPLKAVNHLHGLMKAML
ncbi:MAG: nuclear transport factor 2 family protein [Pseudomonadota bacterium]